VPVVTIDGSPHLLFGGDYHPDIAEPGRPGLPAVSFTLGLPPDAGIDVSLLDPQYEISEKTLVAPVPTYESVGDTDVVVLYKKDGLSYAQTAFLPVHEIDVPSVITLRGQRIATIRLAPYQYNPSTGTLRRLTGGRVEVRLTRGRTKGAALPQALGSVRDPWYEETFRSLLLNYDEARAWRIGQAASATAPVDSTRDWFEPGRPYIVIPTGKDGWHRVGEEELRRAGFPGGGVDPATIRVIKRGREIPIVVRPDGAVEFFGVRNRGDSAYTDFYSDTTAFWMTWGDGPGIRYTETPPLSGIPAQVVRTAPTVLHLEKNTAYYFGTTLREVSDNAEIPGEGWVWEYYYPNSSYEHPFLLDSLDDSSPAAVRVRLYSTTLRYSIPDHRARFWLNDSLLGDLEFRGRDEATFEADIPAGWLRTGSNSLRITSIPTLSSPNQFYLNWIEIFHRQFLRAAGEQMMFAAEPGTSGGNHSFVASGFHSSAIEVYDISGGRRLSGLLVEGDSLSGYSVTFDDTVSVERRYLVRSELGWFGPGTIGGRVISDIRSPASGADYLVITHGRFRAAATELAVHRATTNGVRAAVVDVQDIYDQFNYGILHVDAIKRFIRHACESWPRPAPAYLVFVGDASEDSRRYLPTSTKTEYIPAYGHPASDNWYACFDSSVTFLPSMMIGRLPFEDTIQARRTVEKIKRYDTYEQGDWNKKYLFITGGNSDTEQASFNALSEGLIDDLVKPAPLGGVPLRIYKTTSQVIDGESKQSIQGLVKAGLLFMNFLGHSGGRIWNVDIGSPNDLENTSGRLPLVSSVSCNVANFASAIENTLSEDFLMADNRGAIAVWGSSSLGYANTGTALVRHMLEVLRDDTLRTLGSLTTTARYRLWQATGSGYLTVAHINLTPLVGDPMSRIGVARAPDLAVVQEDISLSSSNPAETDTNLSVTVTVRNYGLVPPDSVRVIVDDVYQGTRSRIVDGVVPPVLSRDSVTAAWPAGGKGGSHTLEASLDPGGLIVESDRTNNNAARESYVYVNRLFVLKPFVDAVVTPGRQRLCVTTEAFQALPSGSRFTFELDTVGSFDSPFRVVSGDVPPEPAAAAWNTPPLMQEGLYFWRARMEGGNVYGQWASGRFVIAADESAGETFTWRQQARDQLATGDEAGTVSGGGGVTIRPGEQIHIYVRSLGSRSDIYTEYYSQITLNGDTYLGYWWVLGSSFMVLRVNEFTGRFDFRGFNVSGSVAYADSMAHFIETTPEGYYVAIAVIIDGSANMTERLRIAIESLGSVQISQLGEGHAWSLIARKPVGGTPYTIRESRSPAGITEDSLTVPSQYSRGSGSHVGMLPRAFEWRSFGWRTRTVPGRTDALLHFLAEQNDGLRDTLGTFPPDSVSFGASFLTAASADTMYRGLFASAFLSTLDASATPVLEEWEGGLIPAGDIAVSRVDVVTQPAETIEFAQGSPLQIPFLVHNLGYSPLDSALVKVEGLGSGAWLTLASLIVRGPIAADSSAPGEFTLPTDGFPATISLRVTVSRADGRRDLFDGNNYYAFAAASNDGADRTIQIVSDGIVIVEGDYVASRPSITIHAPASTVPGPGSTFELFVDDIQIPGARVLRDMSQGGIVVDQKPSSVSAAVLDEDPVFSLSLSPGSHDLRALVIRQTVLGVQDTLSRRVTVMVTEDQRIERLYNFPNPFSAYTDITFIVTGSQAPDFMTIRIFSVAGRRVRQIDLPPGSVQVGFNRVRWDGRDQDGDDVANGVYFLQVEAKTGDMVLTALERMARIR
jgi:hypothetical protein